MIKKILEILISFGVLFFIVYGTQHYVYASDAGIRYNLINTNLFFAVSSAVICLALLVLDTKQKFKPQLGFIYLPTIFIKGLVFFVLFRESVFSLVKLTLEERLNLLIPLFIFLVLEVYFAAKVINKN